MSLFTTKKITDKADVGLNRVNNLSYNDLKNLLGTTGFESYQTLGVANYQRNLVATFDKAKAPKRITLDVVAEIKRNGTNISYYDRAKFVFDVDNNPNDEIDTIMATSITAEYSSNFFPITSGIYSPVAAGFFRAGIYLRLNTTDSKYKGQGNLMIQLNEGWTTVKNSGGYYVNQIFYKITAENTLNVLTTPIIENPQLILSIDPSMASQINSAATPTSYNDYVPRFVGVSLTDTGMFAVNNTIYKTAFNKNFGTVGGTVCVGNDPRLSDARSWSGYITPDNTAPKPSPNAQFGRDVLSIYSKSEVDNLISQLAGGTFLKGDIKEAYLSVTEINANFDATGLGIGNRVGWALCNGLNGTVDKRGRVGIGFWDNRDTRYQDPSLYDFRYGTPGSTMGEKAHTLVAAELPSVTGLSIYVTANGYPDGSGDRSSFLNYLVHSSQGGTKLNYPVTNSSGGNQPHETRQPSVVLVYMQKIV